MRIETLDKELSAILSTIVDNEQKLEQIADQVHEGYRLSAKNLCRYLILRTYDLRKYHDVLSSSN